MKTTQQLLDIQAYVDGELDAGRRAEIERMLATDDEARALQAELAGTRALVRSVEPGATVPDSREFYWSRISRRMAEVPGAEAAEVAEKRGSPLHWLRWLVPALGLGAIALVLNLQRASGPAGLTPDFETSHTETTTITFRSESDGITIHWLN